MFAGTGIELLDSMSKSGGRLFGSLWIGLLLCGGPVLAQNYGQFYMIKSDASLSGQSLGANTLVEISQGSDKKYILSIYKYDSKNQERNLTNSVEVDLKAFEGLAKISVPVQLDGKQLVFKHPLRDRTERINLPNDRCEVPLGGGQDTKEEIEKTLKKIEEKLPSPVLPPASEVPQPTSVEAPASVKHADEEFDPGSIAVPVGFSISENLTPQQLQVKAAWLRDATQTWRDLRTMHELELMNATPAIAKARSELAKSIPDLKKRQAQVMKDLERAKNKKTPVDADTLEEQKNITQEFARLVNALDSAAKLSDFSAILHSPELKDFERRAAMNMGSISEQVKAKSLGQAVQSAKDASDFLGKVGVELKSIDKDTYETIGYKTLMDYVENGFPVLMSDGSFQRDARGKVIRKPWSRERIENALLTLTAHAEMAGFLFDGRDWLTRPDGPYLDLGRVSKSNGARKIGAPLAGEENPLYAITVYRSLEGRAKSNKSYFLRNPTRSDPNPILKTSIPGLSFDSDFMPGSPVRAVINKSQFSCWDVGDPRLAQILSPNFKGEGMEAYSLYYTVFALAADRAGAYEVKGLDGITHYWSPVARKSTPDWDDGNPSNGETTDIDPASVTAKFLLGSEEKIYRLKSSGGKLILKPSYE